MRREWTNARLYSEGIPTSFITFPRISIESHKAVLSALRAPGVSDGKVRALEIGPGYYSMVNRKPFASATFVDVSHWTLSSLRQAIEKTGNTQIFSYLVSKHDAESPGAWPELKNWGASRMRELEEKFKDAKQPRTEMRFVQADARKLPFANKKFHLALASEVLTHIDEKDREKVLKDIADKVTHRLVIVDRPPQRHPEHGSIGEQGVNPQALKDALGDKFKVRIRRYSFKDDPQLRDMWDYFVLIADRKKTA